MSRSSVERDIGKIRLLLGVLLLCAPAPAGAGTTGKITGRVQNPRKEPVLAVTVFLEGTRLGAYTDEQGQYTILNVPAGTYSLRFQRVGYAVKVVQGVIVTSDRTTNQDVVLAESAIKMEEVTVTAQRPPVDVGTTSSQATLTKEEIQSLPVQELSDVVNLQAGVVDGHFRGGRKDEVQYQVDGVTVNNAYDNSSSLRLDRSLLQEVQVLSGTFDAEYGQAMSGVVNAVLRQGTERFEVSAEGYGGGFLLSDPSTRLVKDEFQPGRMRSLQLTLSGPVVTNTVFLLSGRYYDFEDYVEAQRVFVPTDSSDFQNKQYHGTGDGATFPLGYSHEWSGAAKLTNTSLHNAKLNYQAIFNVADGRRTQYAFRLNPDGASKQQTFSITHGLDWNQILSKSTYFDLSLRQNYFNYNDYVYKDVFDPRYDAAGPPLGDQGYENGAVVQGVDFTRFSQNTNAFLVKGSVVDQLNSVVQFKAGGDLQLPAVAFGAPGTLVYTTVNGVQTLVRHVDDPPDYPGVKTYYPVIGAAFGQAVVEKPNLTVRGGLRMDYFDARAMVPSDPANPANAIQGAPPSELVSTSAKVKLAPRLGLAFPIEKRAAVHFAYGHFYQYPAIGTIFTNSDYSILKDLQSGGVSYGVLGNPDVQPEKTIQYEMGFKDALTDNFGLDATVFYKDIRDLLGVQFVQTYNDAEYARLTNADFGNVVGFTLALDHRKLGPVAASLDYTWMQALGNSSDPRETATRAEAGADPRPRLAFFDWDLRHKLDLTVSMGKPGNYNASLVLRAASGQPYTPVLEAGFGNGLEPNSGRKPSGMTIDLRGEKRLKLAQEELSLVCRVYNLLDTKFMNGMVFNSTGSPYYSRFPEADAVTLSDPTRFFQPRRIELGVTFGM
jgi:outer membrane receptor for ferrienterochelin and colicin